MKGISIIKHPDCIGYTGAAIYKLNFDGGQRFYIGSCHAVRDKIERVRRRFATNKVSKKFKLLIKDKTKCVFEVLEKIFDVDMLIERETFWIHKHLATTGMLNRRKLSATHGAKRTQTEIKNSKANYKERDWVVTDEWRKNHKAAMLIANRKKDGKAINQYDRNGNLIGTYQCGSIASSATGVPVRSMQNSARGEVRFVHGFYFRYVGADQSSPS